jgi:hypothetical protein
LSTPIADMVAQMLSENEPSAAIIAAVRALEIVTQNNALRNVMSRVTQRDQAKVRQQNFRNRKKEQQLAKEAQANDGAARNANVTQDSVTPPLSDCVLLSSSLLSGEPLKSSKKEKKESSGIQARARGTRMEPGTPLSDEHRAIIVAEGIFDPEKLWAEFVDYWSDIPGQRGIKLKWDGTLRNRCRDVIKRGFNGQASSNNRANQTTGPAPTRDTAIVTGMGRALERRRAARDATDPGRQDVREGRHPGAASGTDAEPGPEESDDGPSRQLALLPAGYARA